MVKNLHGTERSIALSKRVRKIIILCHNKEREIKKRRRKRSSSSMERQIYCKSWFLRITIFNNVVHDRRNPIGHACPERNAMWIQQLNKNRIGIWVPRIKTWKIQAFIAKKRRRKEWECKQKPFSNLVGWAWGWLDLDACRSARAAFFTFSFNHMQGQNVENSCVARC